MTFAHSGWRCLDDGAWRSSAAADRAMLPAHENGRRIAKPVRGYFRAVQRAFVALAASTGQFMTVWRACGA
jgi:hypothetical protein